MEVSHSSNDERARSRTKCRELLSAHIYDRLGFVIAPVDIRLHPRPSDPYRWNILPTKAHLFRKNLSKISTGIYNQIISGIGTFIEAVQPNDTVRAESVEVTEGKNTVDNHNYNGESTSFASRIEALEGEIHEAQQAQQYWKECAEQESKSKRLSEAELSKARAWSQGVSKESKKLRQRSERLQSIVKSLKARIAISNQCLEQLILCTDRVRVINGCNSKEPLPHELSEEEHI
ncbi:MAG: hypothetical protein Q9178_005123 [Gyalolechia marmorata]